MTTRWVPSGDPASEFTRTGLSSGKYWTSPAVRRADDVADRRGVLEARDPDHDVGAAEAGDLVPDGRRQGSRGHRPHPTTVRAAFAAPVRSCRGIARHPAPGAMSSWRDGLSSARPDRLRDAGRRVGCAGDGPVRLLPAGEIARVRGAVREVAEAERAPRHERQHGRRPDDRRDPDQVRLGEDALEEPASLEQRDVGERAAVEPQQVGRDERVPLAALQRLADRGLQARPPPARSRGPARTGRP